MTKTENEDDELHDSQVICSWSCGAHRGRHVSLRSLRPWMQALRVAVCTFSALLLSLGVRALARRFLFEMLYVHL